ncbi:MAG: 3-phosphoserine/phosphohydroxythreonine transaminase [Salinivirgaceae bacterium]|nr:3-phosphoserine/phosphohydroxythreonine transaminase [Salinivirgaceae bacterium]MDD4746596.1 3-phosphoserine/phosphohydroxythreonine transaminase [Salinivirgaceae bacterium]MDY0280711.1 3-phosphoserine/phosphohydroxythreonine transaminase [Salinivirgaceae bacterium]
MKKHIFNAGPCKLPASTLENTAKAILELNNSGQSILEVSHRSKDFQAVMDETIELFRETFNIPADYHVLFVGGGASTQFATVPMNFLKKKAAYINTGVWSEKAIKEAKLFGEVEIIASSEDKKHTYFPKGIKIPTDVDYVHITTNNTIYGTEIFEDLNSPVPVIADMSSDIMSRPVDVTKYALIYGGAQKNLGPAGVTFVIIKDEFLKTAVADRPIPTMFKYSVHAKSGSMNNTPPCVNIFALKETLAWVKSVGGVKKMEKNAIERADMLYAEIDRNKLFSAPVEKGSRSRMNIVFVLNEKYAPLQDEFIKFASERNIIGIKGHRDVGGFRASAYNASLIEDVKALVEAMKEFEKLKA